MTGNRKPAASRAGARDEAVQSDLFLHHAGVDLDGVPSLADGADLATGLLGRIEVLEARVADLKEWLLAEAAKGSRLGGAVAAVDAFNRIASMSTAFERESTLAVVASAGEHLLEVDAVPGGARPHIDPSTGELVDTGDTYFDELPLAAAAIGPALRISDPLARERAWESVRVAQHAPHVHARQLSGDWGSFHVRAFFDQLDHVQSDVIEAADAEIAAVPGRVGVAWLRARIDRFLRAKGLPTRDQVHARGQGPEARNVRLGPTDLFGMANLNAYLPALRAKGIDQLLTDLAGTAPDGDPRTLDQRRADAFLVCFTGPAALNPAVAGQLGYDEAFVADPRFAATTVDARQQQIAREAWESLRLIGATLGLHFAQAPPIELNVHAPATLLIDLHLAARRLHGDGLDGSQTQAPDALSIRGLRLPDGIPRRAGPPGTCPSHDSPPAGAPPGRCPTRHSLPAGAPPDDCAPCDSPPAGAPPCDTHAASPSLRPHPRPDQPTLSTGSCTGAPSCLSPSTPFAIEPPPVRWLGMADGVPTRPFPASFAPYIEGYGPISAAELVGLLDNASLRRIITDPDTGAPIDYGPKQYAPSVAMRRRVQIRDGHCRFPECHTSAAKAQLDHVHEHRADGSGGHTADWNLLSLCQHHHRIKHQTPWTPVMHADGTVTWRNNLLGLTITTAPHD